MSRPSVPLAIVLGLIGPAAGLWYAGKPRIAAAVIAVFLASVVGVPYLAIAGALDAARVPTLLAVSAVLLWGGSTFAGALVALRSEARKRPAWVHPWWVLGVVVLTWVASASLRTRLVAEHWLSFAGITDTHLEPQVHQGALVVVKRAYAPDELVPGVLVEIEDHSNAQIERVKSIDPIVLDDGRRISVADVVGVAYPAR
ncbi:MAG TPA: hypothetical protein VGO62_05775 [Myxococcota bacterium]